MRKVVAAAAVLAISGCSGGGDDAGAPTTPSTSVVPPSVADSVPASVASVSPAPADRIVPEGFEAIVIEVTGADGETESFCVWLAASASERQQGLMQVTDLGGADGMLFRFGEEQSGTFWMKDTVMPLSIAFFGGDGELVSTTDMAPCPPDTTCPLYSAARAYADAIEVPQGGLDTLGIAPGSRLAVTSSGCEPGG